MQKLAEEFKLCTAAQVRAQNTDMLNFYEGIISYNTCGDSLKFNSAIEAPADSKVSITSGYGILVLEMCKKVCFRRFEIQDVRYVEHTCKSLLSCSFSG
jgi:hypothetical protein